MARSHAQQVALALGPKFSASLSLLGSGWIILEVWRDRKKQALVYHRLLLGLSCLDILVSSAWFLSTWPVPKEATGLVYNVGNQLTCNIQGFFIQLKGGNPLYNAWLALYFVCVVKRHWKERDLRAVEPYLHISAICVAVGTSTASLVLGLFGNASLWCWIQSDYPMARMFFFYVWYWASLVIVTVSMVTLVGTVYNQERKTLRLTTQSMEQKFAQRSASSFSQQSQNGEHESLRGPRPHSSTTSSQHLNVNMGKNTAKVATQAMLYIAAYVLTAFFSTTVRTMQAFRDQTPFWALLGMTLFYPAQGFLNFLIYIRPRYLRYRQKHPDWSTWYLVKRTLGRALRFGAQGSGKASVDSTSNYYYNRTNTIGSDPEDPSVAARNSRFGDNDDEDDDDDYKLGTPLEDEQDEEEDAKAKRAKMMLAAIQEPNGEDGEETWNNE
mmetsp:Transcript_12333/g.27797  ORF Transcript_12333/g.27797 Transcript_12333/m.27797 type:complete len:440 (-) Transcript_12333:273-1592(-)